MKHISKVSPYGKGFNRYVDHSIRSALEIDSSNIISPENLNFLLSSLAVHNLGLCTQMKIKTKLSQLILYETGDHFKRNLDSEKNFGIVMFKIYF